MKTYLNSLLNRQLQAESEPCKVSWWQLPIVLMTVNVPKQLKSSFKNSKVSVMRV